MGYDYTSDVDFAMEAIAEFGRAVSFVKQSTDLADVSKPLHGALPPLVVDNVPAVFVEPSSVIRLGASDNTNQGLWRNSTKIALVAPDGTNDFATFTGLVDSDGTSWKINHVETLKPGATVLLYYVGVKR